VTSHLKDLLFRYHLQTPCLCARSDFKVLHRTKPKNRLDMLDTPSERDTSSGPYKPWATFQAVEQLIFLNLRRCFTTSLHSNSQFSFSF